MARHEREMREYLKSRLPWKTTCASEFRSCRLEREKQTRCGGGRGGREEREEREEENAEGVRVFCCFAVNGRSKIGTT